MTCCCSGAEDFAAGSKGSVDEDNRGISADVDAGRRRMRRGAESSVSSRCLRRSLV